MGDDRSEQQARQIREALGPLNDESDALTLLIGKLRDRLAQLEAVAEAEKAESLRLREALTLAKRLFCEAHLKVCQLHKVAEAAGKLEEWPTLDELSDEDRDPMAAVAVAVPLVRIRTLRNKLAALRDGGDDGK